MFTTILELAISMAFFFLMFSAICSAIQELVANALRWRAKNLEQGIAKLVGSSNLAAALYQHPVISALKSPRWLRKKMDGHNPSYIPPTHFASALMDTLKISPDGRGTLNFDPARHAPELQQVLNSLVQGVGTTPEKIRKAIEDWFDESMNRVSGWYKRKAHAWMWLIGGVVCLLLNADSINVAKLFWNDEALRAATVKAATEYVQNDSNKPSTHTNVAPAPGTNTNDTSNADRKLGALPPKPATVSQQPIQTQPGQGDTGLDQTGSSPANPGDQSTDLQGPWRKLSVARAKLTGLNIPIGWCKPGADKALACWPFKLDGESSVEPGKGSVPTDESGADLRLCPIGAGAWFTKLIGILMTVLAISQGAPFWFDALQKIANLRLAGEAPGEKKK
jgi:hypothetical protein